MLKTNSNSEGRNLALQAITTTLLFLVILLLLTIMIVFFAFYRYTKVFSQETSLSRTQIWQLLQDSLQHSPILKDNSKTVLILGTDSLENRPGHPVLTDTIIYAKINLKNNQVRLLSLPRDLWSSAYQTKINALYHYSLQRYQHYSLQRYQQKIQSKLEQELTSKHSNNPSFLETKNNDSNNNKDKYSSDHTQRLDFLNQSMFELTNIQPQHVVVVSPEQIVGLIDIIQSIQIDVEKGFTDEKFPKSDVALDAPESELYQTIRFEAGIQDMDAQKALFFIRSRNGDNDTNTDIDRSKRQRQVLTAIQKKIFSSQVLLDPVKTAGLYNFYQDHFEDQIAIIEVIGILNNLRKNNQLNSGFDIIEVVLPIFPEDEDGVIRHPHPSTTNGQWVYAIDNLENFQEFINKNFIEP